MNRNFKYRQLFKRLELHTAFEVEFTRFVLWLPLFLSIGIALYFGENSEPDNIYNMFVLFAILALLGVLGRKRALMHRLYSVLNFVVIASSLIALGYGLADLKMSSLDTKLLQGELFGVEIEGVVKAIETTDNAKRFYIKINKSSFRENESGQTVRLSRRGRNQEIDFGAGDIVSLKAVLRGPSAPFYINGYDFQRRAYIDGISAYGYIISDIRVLERNTQNFWFENTRLFIEKKIYSHIDNSDTASIVTAFMTGEKKAISEPTLQSIRDSGLAHLLAISGLHVGFVAGLVFFFVRAMLALIPRIALQYPIKKIAAFVALLAAAFFTIMVGASVPTQRALLMTSIVLVAVIIDRRAISLRLVALAATIILCIAPEELISPSFQLSFAAVVALVGFYELARPFMQKLYRDLNPLRKLLIYFIGLSVTSIIAGLATAPFTLYYFNHLAVLGVLANMLALPIMGGLIMPFVILSYLLMPIGLAEYPLYAMAFGVEWIVAVANYVSSFELASISYAFNNLYILIGIAIAGYTLFFAKTKLFKFSGVCILFLLVLFSFNHKSPDILISTDDYIYAVKDEQGDYVFSDIRENKFMIEQWAQITGQKTLSTIPSCDQAGCISKIDNIRIIFSKNNSSLYEDCFNSDIIFTRRRVPHYLRCSNAQMIPLSYYRDEGVLSVYLKNNKQTEIISIKDKRGMRPWTVY